MPDLSDTMAKCRIGTAKFFTLLLLLYRTSIKTLGQKLDGSGDTPTDPRGTDTGCHADLFLGDVAGSISVDEFDSIWDFEFYSTEFRLLGE